MLLELWIWQNMETLAQGLGMSVFLEHPWLIISSEGQNRFPAIYLCAAVQSACTPHEETSQLV